MERYSIERYSIDSYITVNGQQRVKSQFEGCVCLGHCSAAFVEHYMTFALVAALTIGANFQVLDYLPLYR